MARFFSSLYFIGLFLLGLLVFPTCNKNCEDVSGDYDFELPVSLSPARDTYRIGDTIYVSSIFADVVLDRNSQNSYVLENFLFFPKTYIQRIDTFPTRDGLPNFEVILDPNQDYYFFYYSDTTSSLLGEYLYFNQEYSLSYKFIPLKAGLYCFTQGSSLYPIAENQEFPGKCPRHESDASCILNGGGDNNVDFLSRSPDPHYNDWILQKPESRYHRFAGYCFYVVE